MMKYRITGKITLKEVKKFSRQVEAKSEKLAKQKIYSFFGNVYRIPRRKIAIEEINEL